MQIGLRLSEVWDIVLEKDDSYVRFFAFSDWSGMYFEEKGIVE